LPTKRIAELPLKYRVPAISPFRVFVEEGGLMSYWFDKANLYRRAATMVDRVLKGAKPSDLSVVQPTTLELVINLKTAKSLGLTIPPSILSRADEVIE
jgi:putative ABC transport system substrate-binding protein